MNAEDYCEELLYLKEQISYQRKILENTLSRDDITFVKSQNYDGSGVHSRQWKGGVFKEIEKKIDNLPAATSEYKKAIREYINRIREFNNLLGLIRSNRFSSDMRYMQYLTNRYLFGMSINAIANDMGLSYETVRKLKKPALEALQRVLDQSGSQGG